MFSTCFCRCHKLNTDRRNNKPQCILMFAPGTRNRKRARMAPSEMPASDRKNCVTRQRLQLPARNEPPRKLRTLHSISDAEANECWIQRLPHEILLLVFHYLPLAVLLFVVPHVCKSWKALSMDWTLWKTVEHLRIKTMVVTTTEVRTLLNNIPKLKKLELILRNDTEELLKELFRRGEYLETLRLDRCVRNRSETTILPYTVKSILSSCPKLKSVSLTNIHFRSRQFYECLALKFKTLERINISCTTKSEMDFFVENLKRHVPEVEFQNISMMGRAGDKQIYWGPILGLLIRPDPTSPYYRQQPYNEFPNYAF